MDLTPDPVRSAEQYADTWAKALPTGPAWPKERDTTIMQFVLGMSQAWAHIDARAHDLRDTEALPDTADQLLSDWERVVGLPDNCLGDQIPFDKDGIPIRDSWSVPGGGIPFRAGLSRAGQRPWRLPERFDRLMQKIAMTYGNRDDIENDLPATIPLRRQLVISRLIAEGGQSRQYFIDLATALGYPNVQIKEFSPFRAGRSRCGSTYWRTGTPHDRFVWAMFVGAAPVRYFRAGRGRAGRDPRAKISRAFLLECLVRRWAPGHTQVIFQYSNSGEI